MSAAEACRFLRPALHRRVRIRADPVYARFFSVCRHVRAKQDRVPKVPQVSSSTADYEKRLAQLQAYADLSDCYPRLTSLQKAPKLAVKTLLEKSDKLDNATTDRATKFSVSGMHC